MTTATQLDVEAIRKDFPVLHQTVHGQPLAYLDNAASTQKPREVIDAIAGYYAHDHANVHRGVHTLSQRATDLFEEARRKVQHFMGAGSEREIIFTKGCTEAINLVASSWGKANLKPGDRIVLTAMEHHADIVPWQMVCQATGAEIVVAPINDAGELLLDELEKLLDERVKLVGCVHVSNALGTVNPIEEVIRLAHRVGAKVLIDGAQSCAHVPLNVKALDVDFYTLSGHKLYGPTGIGCLYGKRDLLEAMPPYQGGGDMIRTVTWEKTTYNDLPNKFEPGTPHISGAIGLGVAIDYVKAIGLDAIGKHEHELTEYATSLLAEIPHVRLVGTAAKKSGIVSFVMDNAHPHDIGTILDSEGVAIRAGHHCCMPLMARLGVPATARASFAIYSTRHEIDTLARALRKVNEVFA
ncbi:MAG: cysteine desulfurase [Fimbriimonadales bacterium]